MSSILNVAAVSETLRTWIHEKVQNLDGGPKAQLGRPDKLNGNTPLVNVYLYETTKNSGYGGIDLPMRSSEGALTKKPVTAVDLHYLISFWSLNELQCQILLATVVRAIHAHGGLSRTQLKSTIDATGVIKDATVHDQHECVRLSTRNINVDEMSKLWGMFPNIPYVLSIGVTATTVVLESDFEPEAALPVQSMGVTAVAFTEPRIESIAAIGRPKGIVYAGDKLIVLGHQLIGSGLTIKTDTADELVREISADSPVGIVWTLPATVPAGVRYLVIEKPVKEGSDRFVTSSAFPFLLRPELPSVSKTGGGKTLNMPVKPKVLPDQKAVAVLTKLDDASVSWTLPATIAADKLTADLKDVTPGKYMVRVRVDGAESLLTYDNSPDKVVQLVEVTA